MEHHINPCKKVTPNDQYIQSEVKDIKASLGLVGARTRSRARLEVACAGTELCTECEGRSLAENSDNFGSEDVGTKMLWLCLAQQANGEQNKWYGQES